MDVQDGDSVEDEESNISKEEEAFFQPSLITSNMMTGIVSCAHLIIFDNEMCYILARERRQAAK